MSPLDTEPAAEGVATTDVPVSSRAPGRLRIARNLLAGSAFVLVVLACASRSVSLVMIAGVFSLPLLFAAATCHGVRSFSSGQPTGAALGKAALILAGWSAAQIGFVTGAVALASYLGNGFRRGRQMRHNGRVVLAEVCASDPWPCVESIELPEVERARVADLWRDNGRTEHASVAAFSYLAQELMELGAPHALIVAAQQDGQDEMRHTELCFALAQAIDGRALGPCAFPTLPPVQPLTRAIRLQRLAVDSLFDGTLHEGLSARIVAKLTRRCEVDAIRDVLTEIARDEGRHAAHAWEVVEWCVAQGGDDIVHVLRGALATIPPTIDAPLDDAARVGAFERYGLHGEALASTEYAAMRAQLARMAQRILVLPMVPEPYKKLAR